MRQLSVDDVAENLHVSVWVRSEAGFGLHQVVIDDTEDAKLVAIGVEVLSKGKMKPGTRGGNQKERARSRVNERFLPPAKRDGGEEEEEEEKSTSTPATMSAC